MLAGSYLGTGSTPYTAGGGGGGGGGGYGGSAEAAGGATNAGAMPSSGDSPTSTGQYAVNYPSSFNTSPASFATSQPVSIARAIAMATVI